MAEHATQPMKLCLGFWAALIAAILLTGQISPAQATVGSASCEELIGQWRWFNGAIVTCSSDGFCKATNGFSGPWRCIGPNGQFEIQWGREGQKPIYIDTLQLSQDGSSLSGKNQLGGGLSASRIGKIGTSAFSKLDPSKSNQTKTTDTLSADQQQLVNEFGWPQSFLITFTIEVNDGKNKKFRYEIWYYYNVWTSFSFINGIFTESEGIDRLKGDISPLPYTPYDFKHGMQWHEVQRYAGHQKVVRLTPQDLAWDDVPEAKNVNVYFTGQTIAGFDGSGLTLILALPQVTAQQ